MTYRVILLANGEYKKTLHRAQTKLTIFSHYHKIIKENKVYFPRQFINSNGIRPIKYQICVSKVTEENDEFRTLRDEYGKLYTEKPLGDWTILASDEYFIEETFWIYGFDNRGSVRPTIVEIIKKLMKNAHAKKVTKQIIVVYNKLLIYNEDQFDMVICKNMLDAQRLHHTLSKIATKQKIKSLLFMGTASKANIGRYYDLIQENTKWKIEKIRRTSTCP